MITSFSQIEISFQGPQYLYTDKDCSSTYYVSFGGGAFDIFQELCSDGNKE